MSRRLMETYFPVEEVDRDKKIQQEQEHVISGLLSLVQSAGWPMLRARFDYLLTMSEVRPGGESEMLYQIGKREALQQVKALFDVMEQELRNEQRASQS